MILYARNVTMIVQVSYNVISLNVRGLRNRVKRRSIFCFLKDQKCDVYFLQETYSKPKDENIWRSEWGGDIFFSHGSLHSLFSRSHNASRLGGVV